MCPRSIKRFKAVVIGVSTGGVSALKLLLGTLPVRFPLPIVIVSHISPGSDNSLANLFDTLCSIKVKEADECEVLMAGTVYLAPANYHLLIEHDGHVALSVDPPVNFARPSIDVLFESAADTFGAALIGIILTGAGSDGSKGLLKIKTCGGLTIVQDPLDAEMDAMPKNALQLQNADHVVSLQEIPLLLERLVQVKL